MSQLASTAERSTRANFIQKKIDDIIFDLQEQDRFKYQKIKDWSDYCKELVHMNELKIELKDIAKHIIKEIKQRGIDIHPDTVYASVPSDCKTEYEDRITKEQDSEIRMPNIKYKPSADLTAAELQQEVEELKPSLDQLNEEKRRKTERFNELLERASREKIALTIPVKAESKSTPHADSGESELSDELLYLAEDINSIRENVITFKPSPEDAKTWAGGVRGLRMTLKGYTDAKYSKSIPEWFRVQITNIQSGKHAAAVKHATMLPGGIKRNLTREQVGDNAEFILDAAWKALNSFDGFAGLIAWHTKYMEPNVAQRKVDLSPDLSDKA